MIFWSLSIARNKLKNGVFCGRGFIDQVKLKRIDCQRNAVVLGPFSCWEFFRERGFHEPKPSLG
jgi:hypothetical protein